MAMKKKLCFFFGMFYIIFVFTSSLHPSIIIITFLVKAALRASGHTFSPLCENQRACVFDIFTQPSRQCWSKQEKRKIRWRRFFFSFCLSWQTNRSWSSSRDIRQTLRLCRIWEPDSSFRVYVAWSHQRRRLDTIAFFLLSTELNAHRNLSTLMGRENSRVQMRNHSPLVGGARNCDFKVHSHIRGAHIRWRWRRDYRVSLRDGWLDRKHFISEMWIIAAWNSRRDLISWLFFLVFIRFRAHILPAISVEVLRVYWIFSSLRALALKSNLNSSWWGW